MKPLLSLLLAPAVALVYAGTVLVALIGLALPEVIEPEGGIDATRN